MGDEMIAPTQDYEYISSVIKNPKVWPWVSDDASDLGTFEPSRDVDYLLATDGDSRIGFFMIHALNGFCVQIHTVIDPNFWGRSLAYAKEVLVWIFTHTQIQKVITFIPDNNPKALRLAEKAGMAREGFLPESFRKNGVMIGQHLLGVTRGQICQ